MVLLEWYDGRIIAKETKSFTNRSRYATIEHNYGKEFKKQAQVGWFGLESIGTSKLLYEKECPEHIWQTSSQEV